MTFHDAPPIAFDAGTRRRWSVRLVERSARSREETAPAQLLAIFDVLDDLFRRGDRGARVFVESLAVIGRGETTTDEHREIERDFAALIDVLAAEASVGDSAEFASAFRLLVNGAVMKSIRGDLDASLRAKAMAVDLLARHGAGQDAVATRAHPVDEASWTPLDLDSYGLDQPAWL